MPDTRSRHRYVQLAFSEGTPLPKVLSSIDGERVRIKTKKLGTERIAPMLEIDDGEAHFAPGGSVIIKLKEWRNFRTCFTDSRSVLMIRDSGGTMSWNYFYCKYCGKNSGKTKEYLPGADAGTSDVKFMCPVCQCSWWHKGINI